MRFAVHKIDSRSGSCSLFTQHSNYRQALKIGRQLGQKTGQNGLIEDKHTGVHLMISPDGSVTPTERMIFGQTETEKVEEESLVERASEAISKAEAKLGLSRKEAIVALSLGVARGLVAYAVFRVLAGPPRKKRAHA